jgi:hypothetical protein
MAEGAEAASPPPLEEALSWVGSRADDAGGARIGAVQAVYVDAKDGKPAWLIVKLGRFGGVTALPYAECAGAGGRVWVAREKAEVRAAPAVRAGRSLIREEELDLCAHYSIPAGHGRHAAVEGRPAKAVTSKPA